MTVDYGRIEALHGISLSVEEGELVTLIGANGAGKTTTMRAISGIRPLTKGSIIFDGQDITKMKAHQRVMAGIVQAPEGRGVFPGMTVQENLDMGHYGRKFDNKAEYKADPRPGLRAVPAAGGAPHRSSAARMSGGEQQMVAIGRALMARPRVLLLDEPSMGLAPMIIQQIFRIISEINETGVDDPAGRAERPAGAVPLRPGVHPGNRRGRQVRPRPGTAGRPGDQGGLPRRGVCARGCALNVSALEETTESVCYVMIVGTSAARQTAFGSGASLAPRRPVRRDVMLHLQPSRRIS